MLIKQNKEHFRLDFLINPLLIVLAKFIIINLLQLLNLVFF